MKNALSYYGYFSMDNYSKCKNKKATYNFSDLFLLQVNPLQNKVKN
jgi:hypothetical protein